VRVPIPIVIFLIIAVVGGVWWNGTRLKDYRTPPSAEKLREIEARVVSSFPQAPEIDDAISEPIAQAKPAAPVTAEPPKPEINLGNPEAVPQLTEYADRSANGSAHLIELAAALEARGHFQRALLAWERVIDLTKPDDDQLLLAISNIKRLRPTLPEWNTATATAIPITLHAGTGRKMAKSLTPILEQAARDIETASAGLIKVNSKVTAAKSNLSINRPTPVAIWLAGQNQNPRTTEVLSFTNKSPQDLHREVLTTIFKLVRSHLNQSTSHTLPAALAEQENPLDALSFRISRLCWSEFATSINLAAEKKLPPVKKP